MRVDKYKKRYSKVGTIFAYVTTSNILYYLLNEFFKKIYLEISPIVNVASGRIAVGNFFLCCWTNGGRNIFIIHHLKTLNG